MPHLSTGTIDYRGLKCGFSARFYVRIYIITIQTELHGASAFIANIAQFSFSFSAQFCGLIVANAV